MFLNVHVSFNKNNNGSRLFGELQDELSIDCADFSEERRDAVIAELTRKITKAWSYMADRSGPLDPKTEPRQLKRTSVLDDDFADNYADQA